MNTGSSSHASHGHGSGLGRSHSHESAWPTYELPPSAAFFDVDGTLLAETTTYLFARILRRKGLVKRSIFLRAIYHGFQHHFGRLDYGKLVEFGMKSLADLKWEELLTLSEETFRNHIYPRLYQGAEDHAKALRLSGTPVVLVSSSPRVVIQPLADHLQCADVLTTPVEIVDGQLKGIGPGPPCYGEGKLHWARLWAEERGLDFSRAVAYADNWSDRHLLEQVGQAIVVHPRRRLKRLALERRWTIIKPRRPNLDHIAKI